MRKFSTQQRITVPCIWSAAVAMDASKNGLTYNHPNWNVVLLAIRKTGYIAALVLVLD